MKFCPIPASPVDSSFHAILEAHISRHKIAMRLKFFSVVDFHPIMPYTISFSLVIVHKKDIYRQKFGNIDFWGGLIAISRNDITQNTKDT